MQSRWRRRRCRTRMKPSDHSVLHLARVNSLIRKAFSRQDVRANRKDSRLRKYFSQESFAPRQASSPAEPASVAGKCFATGLESLDEQIKPRGHEPSGGKFGQTMGS